MSGLPTPPPGSQDPSDIDDKKNDEGTNRNLRKRPAQDAPTGPNKRLGAFGRGSHSYNDLSTLGITNLGPQPDAPQVKCVVTEVKTCKEALRELQNSAPSHKRDFTMKDAEKKMASCTRRFKPVIEDNERRWLMTKTKTSLKTYQMLGVGWMRSREKEKGDFVGGIQADEMGLGKTLQMLTVIFDDLAANKKGTTLIVSSTALLTNVWQPQIREHFDKSLSRKVMFYKGFDFYQANQVDKRKVREDLQNSTIVLAPWSVVRKSFAKINSKKPDPLHKFEFDRIVLDECTTMKNYKSQVSIACRSLRAPKRWLISGTPLEDKLDELFSYFEFLKFLGISNKKAFSKAYFTRTRIVSEPDPVTGEVRVEYEVEANEKLREVMSNIMIHRTAQTTLAGQPILRLPKLRFTTIRIDCQPLEKALHEAIQRALEEEIENMTQLYKARKITRAELTTVLLTQFGRRKQNASHFLLDPDGVAKLLPDDQLEAFVEECMVKNVKYDDETLKRMKSAMADSLRKNKGLRRRVGTTTRHSIDKWASRPDHTILLSAKNRGVLQLLKMWMDKDPNRKIIVFSIYIAQLEILARMCQLYGWGTRYYHGSMTEERKNKSLKKWRTPGGPNILLCSLGAGGKGLNLVQGSRAIITDLHWNNAAEAQAIKRIHRIGQKLDCEVVRVLVNDTYDEPLYEMQKRKKNSIAAAMSGIATTKKTSLQDILDLAGSAGSRLKDALEKDGHDTSQDSVDNDGEDEDAEDWEAIGQRMNSVDGMESIKNEDDDEDDSSVDKDDESDDGDGKVAKKRKRKIKEVESEDESSSEDESESDDKPDDDDDEGGNHDEDEDEADGDEDDEEEVKDEEDEDVGAQHEVRIKREEGTRAKQEKVKQEEVKQEEHEGHEEKDEGMDLGLDTKGMDFSNPNTGFSDEDRARITDIIMDYTTSED